MMIIEPVIKAPLERAWLEQRALIEAKVADARNRKGGAKTRAMGEARALKVAFLEKLRSFRVLDPACGSGNFLYLALKTLKDLEHKVNTECEGLGLARDFPAVGPENMLGIEINPFAAELARVSVWIGEIQWMREHGFDAARNPILRPLETIRCHDALLTDTGAHYAWPPADVIVGNPPFLGAKLMKSRLGATRPEAIKATETLRAAFAGRLAGFTDLVCYWFEKAHELTTAGKVQRVGLVATSSIRGGTNRPVLDKIAQDLEIYNAWSERPWEQDGARVEVSMICFRRKGGDDEPIELDGAPVTHINPDLTSGTNLTRAVPLPENEDTAFLGIQKSGPFDVPGTLARQWLALPNNPNRRPNADILKPYWNGDDVTERCRDMWLIDFAWNYSEADAAMYQAPFEYLRTASYSPDRGQPPVPFVPYRQTTPSQNDHWWEAHRPRPEMRQRISQLPRYIVTTETSQYRLFTWLRYPVLPDKNLIVITRDEDVMFGILHSRAHEVWALRLGTSLEDRPRYTHTTTFATFPFPDGLTPDLSTEELMQHPQAAAISAAAVRLHELRENWLNPSNLLDRIPEVAPGFPDRLEPRNAQAAETLRGLTLTSLYNERPTWLQNAHRALDEAVFHAYGWPADISDDDLLDKLFALNQSRAALISNSRSL